MLGFEQNVPLEDAIGIHDVAGVEARPCVRPNSMTLGAASPLCISTINCDTTLKVEEGDGNAFECELCRSP